jgi:arginine decarboxylase
MINRHLDQARAPIYEAIVAHAQRHPASYHIPGHKSGHGVDSSAKAYFKKMMSIDLTELPGLDDLHQPEGVIDEAQQLAAQCFGAQESFFLVGGSTVGNLAMILSTCERNDVLIVQRNAHKSIIHGLMLAGVQAVFITPYQDSSQGVTEIISYEDVEQALQNYPQAKGLLITNPDYYGLSIDLQPIASLLHQCDMLLMVDEAHGAHFGFHPSLPRSALSCGADIVVQSTHKMLTSMTMGAILHVQGNRVNVTHLKQTLGMLQSSSPSYPILASIDLARRQIYHHGQRMLTQSVETIRTFRNKVSMRLPCFGQNPNADTHSSWRQDPFKITLTDLSGTLTGHQIKEQLELRGCYPELSNERQVLLICTIATSKSEMERLYDALVQICKQERLQKKELTHPTSNRVYLPRNAVLSKPTRINLPNSRSASTRATQGIPIADIDQAIGKLAAETIIPYPPGIPLWFQGEIITASMTSHLKQLAAQGVHFQGTSTSKLAYIHIFNS